MTSLIAALPMYDWPERHAEVDAEWGGIRDRLRQAGFDAPEALTRQHEDLYDFWRRPDILLSQTCWGPMEDGLAPLVQVVAQPDYDGIEGGQGAFYSSAIVMRKADVTDRGNVAPAKDGSAILPLDLLRDARFAFNNPDSMSGLMGIKKDLEALGEGLAIFAEQSGTGGHRKSLRMVAADEADVAAIDCRSWELARHYEPEAVEALDVVGWTSLRKGLPYITAGSTPPEVVQALRDAIVAQGLGR